MLVCLQNVLLSYFNAYYERHENQYIRAGRHISLTSDTKQPAHINS